MVAGAVHLPGLRRLVIRRADSLPPGSRTGWVFLDMDADWLRMRIGADWLRLPRASLLANEPFQAEPCAPDGTRAGRVTGLSAAWEPIRVLTGPGIRVACEDTDFYRDGHQESTAPRLTDEEFARSQRDFALAWQQIQTNHPAYGPALAAGLAVLTPASAGASTRLPRPAARQAFGAIETALPAEPTTLALELIRGFQYVKLAGLLELLDLVALADSRSDRAPAQARSRPLEGMLQGAYANLAVTEFWRARAELRESDYAEAHQRYVRWRAHTAEAIDTLTGSNSLTPLGARFVEGMQTAISAPGKALGIR